MSTWFDHTHGTPTLRDQFAMSALTGLVAGITKMDEIGIITNRPNDCAEIAYVYADAMLAARQAQGKQP